MSTALPATVRLYLDDGHCCDAEARVVGCDDRAIALDRTCFYPGGGGQPPDSGSIVLDDATTLVVSSAYADAHGTIWHVVDAALPVPLVGRTVRIAVDRDRRQLLARYHTVLHVLNTIALRDYGGWITGAQIGTEYSRIDFKLEGFSAAMCPELEGKVNAVLAGARTLRAYEIPEAEFRRRDDLRRTLTAEPPVHDGRVRIVEIDGFDAQACGGTHVDSTAEVGRCVIFRSENKGRINKRLYVRLDPPS